MTGPTQSEPTKVVALRNGFASEIELAQNWLVLPKNHLREFFLALGKT